MSQAFVTMIFLLEVPNYSFISSFDLCQLRCQLLCMFFLRLLNLLSRSGGGPSRSRLRRTGLRISLICYIRIFVRSLCKFSPTSLVAHRGVVGCYKWQYMRSVGDKNERVLVPSV